MTYEAVKIGLVERFSMKSRTNPWKQGYAFIRDGKHLEYPWMTLAELRTEAKKRSIKLPTTQDMRRVDPFTFGDSYTESKD